MFQITQKQIITDQIKRFEIFVPEVAHRIKPGQYVTICVENGDPRQPFTVFESNLAKGTISLIVRETDVVTKKFGRLSLNDQLYSVLGPLGVPATLFSKKNIVCLADQTGIDHIVPICRALTEKKNDVYALISAPSRRELMLESYIRRYSKKAYVGTADGLNASRGNAFDLLMKVMDEEKIDLVYAVADLDILEEVCRLTEKRKIPTRVCLAKKMMNCIGLCGACRVRVDGDVKLSCIDGPEFDGHDVDFHDYRLRIEALNDLNLCQNQISKNSPMEKKSGLFGKYFKALQSL